MENSICFMLNKERVKVASAQARGAAVAAVAAALVDDDHTDDDDVVLSGVTAYKGQWNNLALGELDFKHVPSQLIPASTTKCNPRVGDVCVRLMPVVSRSDEYSAIVDLYNTYVVKGSALIAKRCINSYTGTEELYIPAIPIHRFVSEWNKSLQQFHDMIRCDGLGDRQSRRQRRLTIISNVTEIALKNVPILSDHLWFMLHSIVSKPSLVKQVVQLVGSVASTSGTMCHTGQVENPTVPGARVTHPAKLYLIAKSVPATGFNVTTLGDRAGVTLGLVWATAEDELYDHMRNSRNYSYYVHIGTLAGTAFRCNGVCEWHYYNHQVFHRMTTIGLDTAARFRSTMLAGDTGDSARLLNQA